MNEIGSSRAHFSAWATTGMNLMGDPHDSLKQYEPKRRFTSDIKRESTTSLVSMNSMLNCQRNGNYERLLYWS